MNNWESGPTFPLEEWLGQQKDVLTREYLPGGCLAKKTLVEGTSPVEKSEPPVDLELASHKAQAQAQWGRAQI